MCNEGYIYTSSELPVGSNLNACSVLFHSTKKQQKDIIRVTHTNTLGFMNTQFWLFTHIIEPFQLDPMLPPNHQVLFWVTISSHTDPNLFMEMLLSISISTLCTPGLHTHTQSWVARCSLVYSKCINIKCIMCPSTPCEDTFLWLTVQLCVHHMQLPMSCCCRAEWLDDCLFI